MEPSQKFNAEQARQIGDKLDVDWDKISFEEFRMGLEVELEHGRRFAPTNVTDDDEYQTGKIALAHLLEFPDYYTRLKKLEADAEAYWTEKRGKDMG